MHLTVGVLLNQEAAPERRFMQTALHANDLDSRTAYVS
jgi:hypothetical protein